ncbi:PAS domain S-box protein [Oxynema aestuarii]|uniref:histidine kinase n=1 Tax=Oxynema aestuarii AP17 TaxID=2064643 RepID=A0A6H1TWN6_9CYAN|nr:PAS domain S-box protein [Oxynema aestuarii]QIZ71014.1 PAS domain S-box protein [Oxynema aestuarii AP17]
MLALSNLPVFGFFLSHGQNSLWKPGLVWLHSLSDLAIAIAYYSISLVVIYALQKRRDWPFRWLFFLFVAVFLGSGTTHLMAAWTWWHPEGWLSGWVKAFTASIALGTAIVALPCLPKTLKLPDRETLDRALAREIAERERAEAHYQIMADAMPFGVWMCDREGKVTYVSASFLHLLDMTLEECRASGWIGRLTPPDVAPTLAAWRHCLATGQVWDCEYKIIGKNGREHTIWTRGRPLRDENGAIASWVGINLDISDRKQMERERNQLLDRLATKQRLLEAVLQQMPAGVVVAEAPSGRILLTNDRVREWFDTEQTPVTPVAADLKVHPVEPGDRDPDAVEPIALARTISTGEIVVEEPVEIRRRDGICRTLLTHSTPVRNCDGEIVAGVCTLHDVTERQRIQAERATLLLKEQQLRQLAEQTNERLAGLHYVTAGLSEALTASDVADAIVNTALATLGATMGIVSILDEDAEEFHNIRMVGYPPQVVEQWQRFSATAAVPIADATRTKTTIVLENAAQRDERYPNLAAVQALVNHRSLIVSPMILNDRAIGALAFGFAEERSLSRDDLSFVMALSQQCALALERSRLFEAQRRARREVEQTLEALRDSEARFRGAIESNAIGIAIAKFDGELTYANDAFLEIVGAKRNDLDAGGLHWSPIVAPDLRELDADSRARRLRRGTPTFEQEYVRPDGDRRQILVSSTLLAGYEETVLSFVLDQTERKRVEAQRDRLLKLERAARSEAEALNRVKDEFLAILSHELRTPLNPILGWVKLLRNRKFEGATMDKALETIERNAQLQSRLIEDLLDISSILQGKLNLKVKSVPLDRLLGAAIESVRVAAQAKAIAIDADLDGDIPPVMGDANRLQQIFWNLLSNAVKFTPSGGRITIRLETTKDPTRDGEGAAKPSEIPLPEPEYAQIEIADTGEGIDPEFLPFIFDRFRQADSSTTRKFGGLGLGLAIVRYLVEMHGGTVKAYSEGVGRGTCFTVRLPLGGSFEGSPSDRERSPSSVPDPLDGVRVVWLDRFADCFDGICTILERYGMRVDRVASVSEAIEIRNDDRPDVFVGDLAGLDPTECELLHEARHRQGGSGSPIRAIALTDGISATERLLAEGFDGQLLKPVEPETLIRAIADLLSAPGDR